MSRYTVTVTGTIVSPFPAETVGRDVQRSLEDLADGHGVDATVDSVTVEAAPEPEPTITLTESELAARIAACVAEEIARQQNASA